MLTNSTTTVVIALGGNIGDVARTMAEAVRQLESQSVIHDVKKSGLYRSQPMGHQAGETFLNAAIRGETTLSPLELLFALQQTERELGRERTLHWGPRTIDLDVIRFGEGTLDWPTLQIPHPAAWFRQFVLVPWAEIDADWIHPHSRLSVQHLRDRLHVRPLSVEWDADAALPWELATRFPITGVKTGGALKFRSTSASRPASEPFGPFTIRLPEDRPLEAAIDVLTAATDELLPTGAW